MIIYAGSLVNPALLKEVKCSCKIYDSAVMTLEEIIDLMEKNAKEANLVVRLHTGDPSIYGAIREQADLLSARGVPYSVVPGVSSFCAAAAAMGAEYTRPGGSQTVILTRIEGRTPVPEKENLSSLAQTGASLCIFLSAGMAEKVQAALLKGGCRTDTPAAIVYKASWEDERIVRTTVGSLKEEAEKSGIGKTALILVGDFLKEDFLRSKLYDGSFSHGFREKNT
ncbi:Cobalt-precorrin-4 C(11)-methyltransferase [bioreactor metagenome]|uniref:Cobalt-precorrin-4 C(11)-methyltransferase n=1 Tax=bioreactor metagenome TaxID=1076179 RepID=A0A645FYR7_9ZZZZ